MKLRQSKRTRGAPNVVRMLASVRRCKGGSQKKWGRRGREIRARNRAEVASGYRFGTAHAAAPKRYTIGLNCSEAYVSEFARLPSESRFARKAQ